MNQQARIVLLVIGGVAVILFCVVLARLFLSAPRPREVLNVAVGVQPELRVGLRNAEVFGRPDNSNGGVA